MKYAIIVLAVVVIMHDISITRLHRKVVTLQAFFDDVVRRLEDLKYNSSKPTEKEFTAYDSAKTSHDCIGLCDIKKKLNREDEHQMERSE